jgi:two-component system OmpR family response regulator
MKLLIVEDDSEAAAYLVNGLVEAGHVADHAPNGIDGYALAREHAYDVLVVDRMMPRLDGLTMIGRLRAEGMTTPELILSALGRRGQSGTADTVYRVGDLELDRLAHEVRRAGREIPLQPREFRLLEYLMRHAGQVVTRTMLLENVWDYHFDPQTNVIDVHVSRLRSKIDKGFDRPLLHTVRGAGYMIRETPR